MKASKSTISEGIFSTMLGAYRDYKDATGGEKEMRLDKRILQEVAYKGFQDLSQRLKSAGIDLNNAAAIREPRTQDIIRNNTVKYVEQYMSGGETTERQAAIIGELQKSTKENTLKIPTEWNKKTLFDYFLQAATIRAKVIIALDQQLPDKPQTNADKLKELQNSLEDNQEIVFNYADARALISYKVVIRKNGVYISDYVARTGRGVPLPSKIEVEPHGEMYSVQRPENLAEIYNQYTLKSSKPAVKDFVGATLE